MKIALLCETFARKMGYIQNALPRFLARLGPEVHLICEDLPPYYDTADFAATFGQFTNDDDLKPGLVERCDGFTLHIVGHQRVGGYMRMKDLYRKLRLLQPDVVQCFAAIGWIPLDAAIGRLLFGYELFTANHLAASCYPPARQGYHCSVKERLKTFTTRYLPGRFVSALTSKCYTVTSDCAEIARLFGVESSKIEVMHLGVDTSLFHPVSSAAEVAERASVRSMLGFMPEDIVCVCSGRMTALKHPDVLAEAVARLQGQGMPYKALFIGDGPEAPRLRIAPHCTVLSFQPWQELPRYYRACDISVWPSNESISMLDTAACGLPLVISDAVGYRDHVAGNGFVHRQGDVADLTQCLGRLHNTQLRHDIGASGAQKMASDWSWEARARARLLDYEGALRRRPKPKGWLNADASGEI